MKVVLKKNIGQRLMGGHPWVFANEVATVEGAPAGGEIVDVCTHQGAFLGRGYINPRSRIMIRLLTHREDEQVDEAFFRRRLESCWAYRQRLGYRENCRLVFGEADGLPALIIDKFNDHFVLQTLALGIDRWKDVIASILQDMFHPRGIYERNDVPVRELEGLSQHKGFLGAPFDTTIQIREDKFTFWADLKNGQKTGYFLDQQHNRAAIHPIVRDARVLDAFCYTGTFACHAAGYGAKEVTSIDISGQALDIARRNAAANGLEGICTFLEANAFDLLKQWSKEGRQYDVVMLDPPAFTKSRETLQKAISGYKEINLRGMKLLKKGGFLVSSSCTNLVPRELFLDIMAMAARDAKRTLRQVTFQTQGPDHPIRWGVDNTEYLKFLIAEVC